MLYLGTSGFSYADWKGHFYPATLTARDMLAFYARTFSTCEINSTYYRLPTAANIAAMVKKSSGRVHFVVKTHQSMTHQRTAGITDFHAFTEALRPLQEAGVLGGVLAQFPYSFPNQLSNRGYLADLKARLPNDVDLVVEFRHRSWDKPEVLTLLREMGVGLVNVDEPNLKGLLPPTSHVSSRVGYIRFHGRNQEKWFKQGAEPWERYDYLYSEAELQEWVPRILDVSGRAEKTFVFFNNHWQSQAVTNARQMAELLGQPLPAIPDQQSPGDTPSLF